MRKRIGHQFYDGNQHKKALALQRRSNNARIFILAGDGEMQEGQNWEALSLASKQGLTNLMVIVDANKLQLDNTVENILNSNTSLADKLSAVGWAAEEIDSYDIGALERVLSKKDLRKPSAVIPAPLAIIGTNDRFGESGDRENLFNAYGFAMEDLAETAKQVINNPDASVGVLNPPHE